MRRIYKVGVREDCYKLTELASICYDLLCNGPILFFNNLQGCLPPQSAPHHPTFPRSRGSIPGAPPSTLVHVDTLTTDKLKQCIKVIDL